MTGTIQSFDTSVNLMQSLLWQYNDATKLQSLLQDKQDWYNTNQSKFWDDWYRDVFDLRTANDFGLAVWSIILGQPIIFPNVGDPAKPTWGFGSVHKNFNRGNFVSTNGYTYVLSKETARVCLRLRYYQLTGACTVPAINRALKDVFAEYGAVYLIDNHNMTQNYIFNFNPPYDMDYAFKNFDILPRPATVGSSFSVIINQAWGFDQYHENFDHGNFSEL